MLMLPCLMFLRAVLIGKLSLSLTELGLLEKLPTV
jgi:hypothetical protein